nr:hypothetical protein [Lachnospiraceae bacterium]
EHEGIVHSVTMSFGVAQCNNARSMDEDINAADLLLYEAKEGGRNRVVYREEKAVSEEEEETKPLEEAGSEEAKPLEEAEAKEEKPLEEAGSKEEKPDTSKGI